MLVSIKWRSSYNSLLRLNKGAAKLQTIVTGA